MAYILVRHKVKDFERWKAVFDGHSDARKAATSKGGRILRNADDPNEVFVLWEVGDAEEGRQYIQEPVHADAMEQAGVIDDPDCYFLDDGELFAH